LQAEAHKLLINHTHPFRSAGLETNDIVIPSQIVSSKHARLEQVNGGGYKLIVVPEAKNPVQFEGRPIEGSHILRHGDMLRIGSLDPGVMVTMTYNAPSEASQHVERDIVFGEKTLIQIGRDPGNDVVISLPQRIAFPYPDRKSRTTLSRGRPAQFQWNLCQWRTH
jgi:hypothetical protein